MKRLVLQFVLLLTIYAGSIIKAQENPDLISSMQEKVPAWLSENNVPAAGIGIIEEGKIKYIKAFGELRKDVPASENSIFNIASMTVEGQAFTHAWHAVHLS